MMLLLLLTVLIAGCGGDDADESVPALAIAGIDPNSTVRSRQLAGTFEPGAVVQVTVDTTAAVNNLQVAEGHWSCTIDALAPGSNLVTILATDSSGNQNALLLSLLYDPVSIERWVTPIPGKTVTIGGLVDPAAASLTVTVDTLQTPIVPEVTGDHWRADLSGLADGNNLVTVKVTHPDLAADQAKTLIISVSGAAPVVTIAQVTSPTRLASQPLVVTNPGNLALTIVAPTAVEGDPVEGDPILNPGVWSATLSDLQPGKNPFTVSATTGGVTAIAHDLIVRDDVPPTVISTVPADTGVAVSPVSPVQAVFNETMLERTINIANFTVACQEIPAEGTVSYVAATRTATFSPAAPLPAGDCIATLTAAITDLAGNALNAFSWSFTVN
jgi:hypothetical protein